MKLDKYGTTVEFTPGQRALFYRITYPPNTTGHLLLMTGQGGEITATGSDIVFGSSGGGDGRSYFFAIFSRPFVSPQTFTGQFGGGGRRGQTIGNGTGLAVDFAPHRNEPVMRPRGGFEYQHRTSAQQFVGGPAQAEV